jgi:SAM-dependent methyltransferase
MAPVNMTFPGCLDDVVPVLGFTQTLIGPPVGVDAAAANDPGTSPPTMTAAPMTAMNRPFICPSAQLSRQACRRRPWSQTIVYHEPGFVRRFGLPSPRYRSSVHHGEFLDPLLVQVYDAAFPWSRKDDFFLALVNEAPKSRVLDLGCGTGRLSLGLAAAGHVVTGVDPAAASLDAARAKPGADRVRWVEGTSIDLPATSFDIALMTGHVAQFLTEDQAWEDVLGDLHRALVPGRLLAFDSRDPRAQVWHRWNPTDSRREVLLPDGTTVVMWTSVTAEGDGRVNFTLDYVFSSGERRSSTATLRFRTQAELRSTLATAGFIVEQMYGGWGSEPVGHGDGELLTVARAS